MGVGVAGSTMSLFIGGLFDGDGGNGHDGGGDGHDGGGHGTVHVNFFSPLFMSTFMAAMGAFGIITLHLFHLKQQTSLLTSFATSLAFAYGVSYYILSFFVKAQASGAVNPQTLVGLHAEVLSPVSIDTPGQIAYVTQSGRQTRIAKGETTDEIPRGSIVEIINIVGDIAIIRKANSK